jgi:NAD-dependent deacetylase
VWFGEAVPLIQEASELTMQADILLVIGTSLAVYPAAGLVNYVPANCRIFLVDPGDLQVQWIKNLEFIREKAGTGVPALVDRLLSETDNN